MKILKQITSFLAIVAMSFGAAADSIYPDPVVTDCKSAQEILDVLSTKGDTTSAKILTCMGDLSTFTNGIAAGLPFESGICLDTGSRSVFTRTSNTDADLIRVVMEVNPSFTIGGHVTAFEFETEATSDLLSFHYAYASSEFDQPSQYSDPFALLISVNGGEYENLAKLDNGMPVSIKNLRAGRNKQQNDYGDLSGYSVSSTEYFTFSNSPRMWSGSVIPSQSRIVDGITVEFCAEKAVKEGDKVKIKFVIADTGDQVFDSFVFIKANSLGFADIAGAPIAYDATDVSKAGFTCNWYPVTGAVKYQVDVSNDPDFTDLIVSGAETSDTFYRVNGSYQQGQVFYYRVRAVGKKSVSANSNVILVEIPTTEVAKPTITPDSCGFSSSLTATIINHHTGATLHYTTDGTDPTVYSSTIVSGGSLTFSTNTTLKAIAVYKGVSSPVATATYSLFTPPARVANVQATDGTRSEDVLVTWSAPASLSPILGYKVERSVKSASSWTVLTSTATATSYKDSTATPGVDYTYRVSARNDSGWGGYGSDDGWRAVVLILSPTSFNVGYQSVTKSVSVVANTTWSISSRPTWVTATKGADSITLDISKNEALSPRNGTVKVIAGDGTAHPVTAVVSLSQGKRPAKLTNLEIVGGTTSLEGGESADFRAIATFDDGTTRDVTTESTWTITEKENNADGTVGEHTGHLDTVETTSPNGKLTIQAVYTNSDYESVTESDTVGVGIGFSQSLLEPISVTISGDAEMFIGETKPYRATVVYNNDSKVDKTLDSNMAWTLSPGAPTAELKSGTAAKQLTAYSGGTLTLAVVYQETNPSSGKTVTVNAAKQVLAKAPVSLPVAVDVESPSGEKLQDLDVTTSSSLGGTVWYGQTGVTHDGTDAGRSGYLSAGAWSSMETVVTNAGTVSFWWRVSSSDPVSSGLSFCIDGDVRAKIGGVKNWSEISFDVDSGTHTLSWVYTNGTSAAVQDAGFVDQIAWLPLDPPLEPAVQASDGTHTNGVAVSWSKPYSKRDITGYEVSRSIRGEDNWTVLAGNITGMEYFDETALPGVDYTYRVRAKNDAGFGDYGSDDGWCGISLWVEPDSIPYGHNGGTTAVAVHTSVSSWWFTPDVAWLTVNESQITAAPAVDLTERSGTVTVTAGTPSHSVSVKIAVVQAGLPPIYDVAITEWNELWRTKIQLATNSVPDGVYSPVSVFPAGAPLELSFGWENTTNSNAELLFMPSVGFKLYKAGTKNPVYEWVAAGRDLTQGVAPGSKAWGGQWKCDILKVLLPGDYMLEAEIDPTMDFDTAFRGDNKAIFRFAVCDLSLEAEEVFKDELGWTNATFAAGNDFAQPPHLAVRKGSAGTNETAVQFGPYVPMNGLNGYISAGKNALDLVFLVDYSGSQSSTIQGLVNNIGDFIDQLFIGDPENDVKPISDLRVKIAGFSDYRSDRDWYEWFYEGEFTTDRTKLKSDLSYMKSLCTTYGGGGYNGGESSYDALYYICKGWRPMYQYSNPNRTPTGYLDTLSAFRGTNEASRAVILVTDEPPHLPLDANGCSGVDKPGLAAALREASVNLTVVGDGEYRQKEWNQDFYNNRLRHEEFCDAYQDVCELIETGGRGTLPKFTGDADKLKALASIVASKVITVAEVVEPEFSVCVRGGGTLKFDWKNDSAADTNNTFTFYCEGTTNITRTVGASTTSFSCEGSTTNLTRNAGEGWETVALEFGEGVHAFKWTYGKLGGYESDVVTDCGVLSNLRWEPWHTELEIDPENVPVYYTGVPVSQPSEEGDVEMVDAESKESTVVFDVTCNSIWKVVDHSDWIEVVQGSGTGNGELVVTVATNTTFAERTGYVTVRAGEYGLPSDKLLGTPERTVYIVQEANPYIWDGTPKVLSVDVKPRWPWNSKVDIDFRVQTPAEEGTPVYVKVWGLNKEGGSLVDDYPTLKILRECPAKLHMTEGFVEDADHPQPTVVTTDDEYDTVYPGDSADDMVYLVCPTSGLYRLTWDMGEDWMKASADARDPDKGGTGLQAYYDIWEKANMFHTPEFAVRLQAQDEDGQSASRESRTVRVDMRLASLYAIQYGDMEETDDKDSYAPAGGRILTGLEMVGHPYGAVDPVPVDTRKQFQMDGWNWLDSIPGLPIPEEFASLSNRACVINNDRVAIEGGIISTDTVWGVDKVHVVRDNVFVAPAATLTIEANAIVKFCDGARIFVREFDEALEGAGRHNIVVKGATFVHGYSHVGGDTLYSSEHDTSLAEGGGNVFAQGGCDEYGDDYPERDVVAWAGEDEDAAICVLKLSYVTPSDEYAVTESLGQTRFYSYGQKLGNIQRPSREGCVFYGWYFANPATGSSDGLGYNLELSENYEASKVNMIHQNDVPFSLEYGEGVNFDIPNGPCIYALFCPPGWSDDTPPREDASTGTILLTAEKAVYDGTVQRPAVREVWVGGLQIAESNYVVDYGPGDYTQAGTYQVRVSFTVDYENSPTATYTILPSSTEDREIVFSPSELTFTYKLKGKSLKDVVTASVNPSVPSGDYAITWIDADGRWPSPGDYKVVASFNSNYAGGAITNVFKVAVNHDYDYSHFAFSTLAEAEAEATKKGCRVLYIGGPEDNLVVEYVKNLISNDMEMNEFIVDNYVIWTETNITSTAASYAAFATGMNSTVLPLFAVLSPADMTRPLSKLAGIVERDALLAWLNVGTTLPEDASGAAITCTQKLTYTGTEVIPGTTVTFAGKPISPEDYYLVFSAPPVDVGTYTVKAKFKGKPESNYFGETLASAAFEIVPAALPDGFVGLDPAQHGYDGEMHKPDVSVSSGVPFAVDYGTGDYTSAGSYTVKVIASGNYTGTVEKVFEITRKAVNAAVVVLDQTHVAIAEGSKPTTSLKPNVLAVSDSERTYVKDVDYTIGWGEGDYKTPGTNTITATFVGNYVGTATAKFVIEEAPPEPGVSLPELTTDAQVLEQMAKTAWADADVAAKITSVSVYNKFRDWVDGLDEESRGKLVDSSRAYISFAMSDVLTTPYLLGDTEDVALAITDFKASESVAGGFEVTIELKVGDPLASLKLKAAKAAFAEKIRLGTSLEGMAPAQESDISAAKPSDDKVVLTVVMPEGESGFIMMKIE